MAQRCACILLAERHHRFRVADIASAMTNSTHGAVFDAQCATIKSMVTFGSYYLSLEEALGRGVTLALGTDIAEST